MIRDRICSAAVTRAWISPASNGVGCETPAPALNSSTKSAAQLRRQNRTRLLDPSALICRLYATDPRLFPHYILKYIYLPREGRLSHAPRFSHQCEDRQLPRLFADVEQISVGDPNAPERV